MSLASEIKADVKAVTAAIHNVFTKDKTQLIIYVSHGASLVTQLILTAAPEADAALIQFVEDAATDAVKAAEAAPGGGQDKMAAALKALEADISTKGVTLIETAMRFLLENALLILKSSSITA